MRRHLFIVVSAVAVVLGVFFAADCGETGGTGGTGGPGGAGGVGGTGGIAGSGGSGGGGGGGTGGTTKCESAEDCDDKNECTEDVCAPSTGMCESTSAEDGSLCAGTKGRCYGGKCNFVPVSVETGPKEVVFDWTTDRCEDLDLPDNEAHAVRAEDGSLVLFTNNGPTNYVFRGPDFDRLERVCDPPALVSADSRSPETYENWEWLWSPYRQGATWHMLIHNEFHDTVSPTCAVGDPSPANPCWYNSITYAVSTDGGRTFVKPSPPAHVVAPHSTVWTPPPPNMGFVGVKGYMNPSNIVRGPDHEYYYSMIRSVTTAYSHDWCPMRTDTLSDPGRWRAWDGTDFNVHMQDPYVTEDPIPLCKTLRQSFEGSATAAITFNTYLQRYMLVSDMPRSSLDGEEVCGFYLALSTDLIHWSDRQLLVAAETLFCHDPLPEPLEPVQVQYPSLIDHADSTTNFERPGRTPHLYYTRHNGGLDRDLVRAPLTFTVEE
jgi:hypothetical protein